MAESSPKLKPRNPNAKRRLAPLTVDYAPLLALVGQGISVRKACDQLGLDRVRFHDALYVDQALYNRYVRARECQAEATADKIIELADNVTSESAVADRVRLDALKWTAAKLHPKVYGDYAGKGPDTVNVNVETLHLTALKQLQSPAIQDAEIIPE